MKRLWIAIALVLCLAALAVALWPVEEAEALPSQESECWYYSDASQTSIVGGKDVTCFGVFRWGTQTPYKQCITLGPC